MINKELLKSKLSIRLVVAVALIVVAAGVLSVVGHFGASSEAPEKPAQPQPVPAQQKPQVQPSPQQPASMPAAQQPASVPVAQSAPAVEKMEVPQPTAVSSVAPPVEKPPVEASRHAVNKPPKHERRIHARKLRPAGVEKSGDYLLQFGVFFSESNAEHMLAQLENKGIRPQVSTLVLAGPYPDSASAEKDKQRLELVSDPIDLPEKGYVLKVGLFDSLKNAQQFEAKLKLDGYPVLTQTRIRGGGYAGHQQAEEAVARLRKSGMSAFVVKR